MIWVFISENINILVVGVLVFQIIRLHLEYSPRFSISFLVQQLCIVFCCSSSSCTDYSHLIIVVVFCFKE
jgi:hypothetical protein